MGLSIEKPDVEWYHALPGRGPVYDLVSAAAAGSDPGERLRAVASLGTSGDPRAVRPLVDLMNDADEEIRLAATTALGLLKSGRPVDDLIGRLRDRDERVTIREQAAVALSSIRSTGALRGLREFTMDENEDPLLRSYAGSLLKDINRM